ncbi:MAG TPA: transcriptional regulator [Clostridiales bacterium]|nr:transcriptional regulator [Clostridiales bacterium]
MEKTINSTKNKSEYDMIVAIIGRGFSDYVVSAARDAGATGATIVYGRGTADADKQVFGISLQPERELVLILVKSNERRTIMQAISDKTSLMEEGRGFCFSLPVSEVFGLKRVAEQKKEQIKKAKALEKQKRK